MSPVSRCIDDTTFSISYKCCFNVYVASYSFSDARNMANTMLSFHGFIFTFSKQVFNASLDFCNRS